MARVDELALYSRDRLERLAVVHRTKPSQGLAGVAHQVQRLEGTLALAPAATVHEPDIGFLDVSRVGQHVLAQVPGSGRAEDLSPEAAAHQRRQVSAVVDVRV